ncbi:NAD(P)/FAD-dependent oxidoreductase [Halorubrum laminariae]|uniref:NAD(P)/FAD-dependent oxidoreductase n=1 Tax=Halorubrum laminariae TaxID=1433523 RepID=A0ABD6C1M8_9EURY|nr:FAD-dependent oxidoreductase [Halorubrum laminariae]
MIDRDAPPPAVAVVGGGAVGVTAAADLAARGADVTLYERDDLGSGSSGRAAGVLYDAYAEDVDAAIAARSMERFRAFDRSLPGFAFTPCPYVLAVREGDEDADAVPAMIDRMRTHGRAVTLVDPATLADRFPIAADDLAVAAVATNAGRCDPASYVAAMADRARSEGVAIETETPVRLSRDDDQLTVSRDDGRPTVRTRSAGDSVDASDRGRNDFDSVVVAAGAHTAALFDSVGVDVPVIPYRVQALVAAVSYDGPMVYDATAGVYFRPHPAGLLAGDGTEPLAADPDGYDREADDWFVESVTATLRERLADAATDEDGPPVNRAWAGLCTATPDGDPLVGPIADIDGAFVAAGWQGHGFMRAPAVGEHVAEGVLASLSDDGPDEPWIDAFDPDRFEGDETFDVRDGIAVERRDEG